MIDHVPSDTSSCTVYQTELDGVNCDSLKKRAKKMLNLKTGVLVIRLMKKTPLAYDELDSARYQKRARSTIL